MRGAGRIRLGLGGSKAGKTSKDEQKDKKEGTPEASLANLDNLSG